MGSKLPSTEQPVGQFDIFFHGIESRLVLSMANKVWRRNNSHFQFYLMLPLSLGVICYDTSQCGPGLSTTMSFLSHCLWPDFRWPVLSDKGHYGPKMWMTYRCVWVELFPVILPVECDPEWTIRLLRCNHSSLKSQSIPHALKQCSPFIMESTIQTLSPINHRGGPIKVLVAWNIRL